MINLKRNRIDQSGQIAIVILLIMVVLLTVGLSLASRTTQEVFLSTQEAESARVFNAAESGIEAALSQDFSAISAQTNLGDVGISDVTTSTMIYPTKNFETVVTEGSAIHLNLEGTPGDVKFIWANRSVSSSCDNSASLLASTYYSDSGQTKVIHTAFRPTGCSGDRSNDGFENGSNSTDPTYLYEYTAAIPSGVGITPLFMRVRAVYMDAPVKVEAAFSKEQYFLIKSQADNNLGDENRTIEVGRGLSTAPSFMDYSVYSGGNLEQ